MPRDPPPNAVMLGCVGRPRGQVWTSGTERERERERERETDRQTEGEGDGEGEGEGERGGERERERERGRERSRERERERERERDCAESEAAWPQCMPSGVCAPGRAAAKADRTTCMAHLIRYATLRKRRAMGPRGDRSCDGLINEPRVALERPPCPVGGSPENTTQTCNFGSSCLLL